MVVQHLKKNNSNFIDSFMYVKIFSLSFKNNNLGRMENWFFRVISKFFRARERIKSFSIYEINHIIAHKKYYVFYLVYRPFCGTSILTRYVVKKLQQLANFFSLVADFKKKIEYVNEDFFVSKAIFKSERKHLTIWLW